MDERATPPPRPPLYKVTHRHLLGNSYSRTRFDTLDPRTEVSSRRSYWPDIIRPEDLFLCVDDLGAYLVFNINRWQTDTKRAFVCLTKQSAKVAEKYARAYGYMCTLQQLKYGADAVPRTQAKPLYWCFDNWRRYLCIERVQRQDFVEIDLRIAYTAEIPDDVQDVFLWIRNYRVDRRLEACGMDGVEE